jgi:hypothetical protein
MRESIDQWAQRGGTGTAQVISGFRGLRDEAVATELAYERLMSQRSEELARARLEGRISEPEYRRSLQTLGGEVRAEVGLSIDESAYSTEVTDAAQAHRDRLVEIDQDANQKRTDAYAEWAEKDRELRTTHRQEQIEEEQERLEKELAMARTSYAEQLKELQLSNQALREEDLAYLDDVRETKARQLAGIDADADRRISEINAARERGEITRAEALRQLEQAVADAARRRKYIENLDEGLAQHEGEDWGADFGSPSSSSSSDATPISSSGKKGEPVSSKDPPALPRSPRSAYGAQPQPISVVVNNHNPVVDTPERERKLVQQTREQVRATLNEWTSDALLRGRLG